jgi:hypothetical protein
MGAFACPKCGRMLRQTGEIPYDGENCPVFQCDHCIEQKDLFRTMMDMAFTFAVDGRGNWFDPAERDDSTLN